MQLIESSIAPLSSEGDKILSGLFAETDTFNQNGRRYPDDIYESAYEELIPKIEERRLLGELDHPLEYDEVRLSNVSHAIIECHPVEEDDGIKRYYGKVELLDTPAGMIAQALVKAGINLGISSRGLGSTKQVRDGVDVTQLKLITFDLVADPSFANAVLSPEKSAELSDSLQYIESKLPLNESVETNSVRDKIQRIRESLIERKTDPVDDDIDKVEIESLRKLVESTQETIKSDTQIMVESRSQIKSLRKELREAESRYNALMDNMMKLQDSYNTLVEASESKDEEVSQLQETIIQLKKVLAVEKRGMSYSRVSNLLEGANTENEIEDRLNSLSSVSRKRTTRIITESAQTSKPQEKKLSGLASIISRV